jgi:hypothetical protein
MASAALVMTQEPRRIDRAEAEPRPACTRSVSPVTSLTRSGSAPSHSAMTCAKLVSWPWPADIVPNTNSMVPDGSIVSSARSRAAPVLSSIDIATPIPRQQPRRRASARRAANPAQSPSSAARRNEAG